MTATRSPDSESVHAGRTPVLLSWSGGKDSAMALHTLSTSTEHVVAALLTTVTDGYERISMHGVRAGLLRSQVEALGLPVHEVRIPPVADNATYEAAMKRVLAECRRDGMDTVAFGDLFLQDIREYRESKLAAAQMHAVFPVWGRDTAALAHEFIALGYRARLACVDPRALDASFAGREFDAALLADLPATVDPCGENGEFHTFVYDGPLFRRPVPLRTGAVVEREGFIFCDLLPEAGQE